MATDDRIRRPWNALDLTREPPFGLLKVKARHGTVRTKSGWEAMWLCECLGCGAEVIKSTRALRSGETRSCGCLRRKVSRERATRHGKTGTPEFKAWCQMIARCTNPGATGYEDYGGRGIAVCDRWQNSFEAFLEDVGPRPSPKHSIDRFPDQNGNYEPANVRWATKQEQSRNRRNNRPITCRGETMLLVDWSKRTGIPVATIASRLQAGKSPEEALAPVKPRKERKPKYLTYGGETLRVFEWADRTGIGRATIAARLRLGWSVGQALGFEPR